jgi:hypothetical protein
MKRSGLFNLVNSHPVFILGAGIIVTGGALLSYSRYIRPALQKRKYAEAEGYAEYLFQEELKRKYASKSNSEGSHTM